MIELVTNRHHAPNVMFYCHDSYGLGHLRRTLTLATHLRASMPDMSQLIVTGSPVAQTFPYPDGADFIKLPSVTKVGDGSYAARSLDADFHVIRDMRRDILLSAARHMQPDAFIVDHAPAGLKGEAVATLRYLKEHSPHTKLIVGLRDVMDEAPKVRQSWAKDGVYELFDDLYDMIMVYGHRHFYDVVREYGLSPRAADKTRFVGYLGREPGRRSREEVRASLSLQTDRLAVVTAGGGGDGKELFQTVLAAMRRQSVPAGFDCLLVGGPLMEEHERADLRGLISSRANLHFLDFTDDLGSYLNAADVVVSMGGYNSVCEILSLGKPALIVPRVSPRKEQLIRAEVMSRRGLVRMLHPAELTPRAALSAIGRLLAEPAQGVPRLPMEGLRGFSSALGQLLPSLQSSNSRAAFGHGSMIARRAALA